MPKRLDFEKLRLASKPAISLADEAERRGADRAARWLEKADRPAQKHSSKRRKKTKSSGGL
jgi:hypothetical protein